MTLRRGGMCLKHNHSTRQFFLDIRLLRLCLRRCSSMVFLFYYSGLREIGQSQSQIRPAGLIGQVALWL